MGAISGLNNQCSMPPKCGNLRIGTRLKKTVTQEILETPQSRNYRYGTWPEYWHFISSIIFTTVIFQKRLRKRDQRFAVHGYTVFVM